MAETEKEAIYDEQISPLMQEIIRICKEHKIAMLAEFALGYPEGQESQLKCTTILLEDEFDPTPEQMQALEIIKPKRPQVFAFTIRAG